MNNNQRKTISSELALTLIITRWKSWQEVVHYQLPDQQETERLNLIRLYKLYKKIKEREIGSIQNQSSLLNAGNSINESPSCDPIETAATKQIDIEDDHPLVIDMKPIDHKDYFDYIRMDLETYNKLFVLIEPKIKKQYLIKCPVSAHTRLQVFLRYLATGDSMAMISYGFQIACNTVSKIVTETCEAIWQVLNDLVLPLPSTSMWKEQAQAFETYWDFPHCIGAVAVRQLQLQNAYNNGVKNRKNKQSLAFFAVADANSCFSLINLSIANMKNGKIIFSQSQFALDLLCNAYDLPSPETAENNLELPYIFTSNNDFPLTNNILQPYTPDVTALDFSALIFNTKIESVNKCSDNALNILTNQWKIFQKKFSTNAVNTTNIVKAAVCLHNFLMITESTRPIEDRRYSVLTEMDQNQSNIQTILYPEEPISQGEVIRSSFKQLFCNNKEIVMEWE